MDNYMNKLLEKGLGNIISNSKDKLILSDKIYQKDIDDEETLEKKYLALDLNTNEKMLIDDFIECIRSIEERSNELSYIAGVRDSIKFLNSLGLIKGKKSKKIKKMLKEYNQND